MIILLKIIRVKSAELVGSLICILNCHKKAMVGKRGIIQKETKNSYEIASLYPVSQSTNFEDGFLSFETQLITKSNSSIAVFLPNYLTKSKIKTLDRVTSASTINRSFGSYNVNGDSLIYTNEHHETKELGWYCRLEEFMDEFSENWISSELISQNFLLLSNAY